MYEELKLKRIYKCIIHYTVLLLAFCVIFIGSGNISAQRPAAVFVAIMLYTILYFVVWAIIHFARKAIDRADDKLDKRTKIKNAEKKDKIKKEYKPLYGDGDKK